jgi:putative sigma-54 modulation protein
MRNLEESDVIIQGRHVELTQALKDYVFEKLQRVEVFGKKKVNAVVTLEVARHEHRAEVDFHFDHTKVNVHASTGELYAAIDKAIERLSSKLRTYKSRLQHHHNKPLHAVDLDVHVIRPPKLEDEINDEIDEENLKELEALYGPHEIVAREKRPLKTLTLQEAVMKMDLSNDSFKVFRGEEDQKIKVIYRRTDGNYGVMEVE